MSFEPTYEDIDETGESPNKNEMMKKALEPKTPLQVKLLSVVKGQKRFTSTADRSRWRKLEKKAQGADPESRVFRAWLESVIGWGVKMNRVKNTIPYTAVITRSENHDAYLNWAITNREKVLKKKSAGETREIMEQKEADLIAMYTEE